MPTVAEQLRATREAKNLTIHQVADVTKIRTDHIRALEEGHFDVFAAPVYIKGFTRSYATLLKLDVPRVMEQLEAELSRTEKFCEPPNLTPHPRTPLDFLMLLLSKIDWRKGVIVLGVLLAVGLIVAGFAAWRHHQTRDPLADLKPGVYQPAGNPSAETLPLPPAPKR
jgi:cytoskeleton protein RodZ